MRGYPPEGDDVGHLDVLIVGVVAVRVGRVVGVLGVPVVAGLLDDGGVGPLDVLVLLGLGGGSAADGLVEPGFLFPLGLGQVEHEAVEEVGVADEEAEVVVGAAGFRAELGAGLVGEEVSLGDGHLGGRGDRSGGLMMGQGVDEEW